MNEYLNLEQSIAVARLAYPSLYPSRSSVLNRFYLNCYKTWVDGRIIDLDTELVTKIAVERVKLKYDDITWDSDEFTYKLLTHEKISCNANLSTVPDNVQPDYLMGAWEVILDLEYLLSQPNVHDGIKNNTDEIREIKENLIKRFGFCITAIQKPKLVVIPSEKYLKNQKWHDQINSIIKGKEEPNIENITQLLKDLT